MDPKYKPEELFLGEYSYDDWSVNKQSSGATRKSVKKELPNTTRNSEKK